MSRVTLREEERGKLTQRRRRCCGRRDRDWRDVAISPGMLAASRSQKREGTDHRASGKSSKSWDTLVLATRYSDGASSGLRDHERVSFCHFKSPSLKLFVTGALGNSYTTFHVFIQYLSENLYFLQFI